MARVLNNVINSIENGKKLFTKEGKARKIFGWSRPAGLASSTNKWLFFARGQFIELIIFLTPLFFFLLKSCLVKVNKNKNCWQIVIFFFVFRFTKYYYGTVVYPYRATIFRFTFEANIFRAEILRFSDISHDVDLLRKKILWLLITLTFLKNVGYCFPLFSLTLDSHCKLFFIRFIIKPAFRVFNQPINRAIHSSKQRESLVE